MSVASICHPQLHPVPTSAEILGLSQNDFGSDRPGGFSTRNALAMTPDLSLDRLITQFEMMTFTESPGSGIGSISPVRNSTIDKPDFC